MLAGLALASARTSAAQDAISTYQVDLGPPPATVTQALATRPQRMIAALTATACGQEVSFLHDATEHASGEDILNKLVAKVGWLRLGARSCTVKVDFPVADKFDKDAFNHDFAAFFGSDCAQPVTFAVYEPASEIERSERISGGHVRATFVLSNVCIKRQVNLVLSTMQPKGQIGSDKLPCHIVGDAVHGDWDVAVRDLVRIYYLSLSGFTRVSPGGTILDPATRTRLFDSLLTISGPPWPDDYPLTGCGNTERSTGTPADRADERSWGDDNFGWLSDAWDVAKWILLAILIAILLWLTLGTLGAILPGIVGTLVQGAAALAAASVLVAAAVALLLRLPETENHLLMINTSRYLTNQLIIDADPTDVHFFVDDQREVKTWLLRRLQSIAAHDFLEYNARPYQRYSIVALLNLHDFARDPELVTASQIVLDLATAKFEAGSNEGRRVAPFRRLQEQVEDDFADRRRLTDATHGSDYLVAFMVTHAGHTSQLPEHRAQFAMAAEMVYPSTSSYAPAPAVMSVALGEVPVFDQRVRHASVEIYSRTPSFLVSAGGVRAPSPTPATLGPITNAGENCNDRGAALPTVLIPSGGGYLADPARTKAALVRRDDFLRIEGFYYYYQRDGKCFVPNDDAQGGPPGGVDPDRLKRTHTWSHDDNACVYAGFACGTNIVVPAAIAHCFAPQPGTPWAFLSSLRCDSLPKAKPFFVALYRRPCPAGAGNCLKNWGFFEAVDVSPYANVNAAFAAFRAKVLADNPASLVPAPPGGAGPPLAGTYVSSRGRRIVFDAAATMNDGDRPGVQAIDGVRQPDLGDWALAAGGVLNSSACPGFPFVSGGRMEITGRASGVTIDFCDWTKPMRTEH